MKILIIEDVLSHMQDMHNYLVQQGHNVSPTEADHLKLKEEISRCFQKGVETAIAKEANDFIRKYIEEFNPDIVLVDYELKEGSKGVNGRRFIETFLPNKKIIIVTGQRKPEVNNELSDLVEKAPKLRSICWKHDLMEDDFFDRLLSTINKFNPPPSGDPSVTFAQ